MHHYLVTTYNNEHYLPEMLNSIIRQYPNLEAFRREARVLAIEDCSTDGTRDVLTDLAYQHPNVHVHFNERNQGIGRNRNDLLDWAYGDVSGHAPVGYSDFVLFVDGDDVLSPTHLADKLAVFEQDPMVDVVGGQLELFYEDGAPRHVVDTFSTDPDVLAIANLFECHVYISNALFRGRVFRAPGVRFPETPTSEDWLFFAQHQLTVRHIPQATLQYRRHSANVTLWSATGQVTELRHMAHRLSALRMGMHLSTRDCELVDLVGYLSFRIRWDGRFVPAEAHMPWFAYLNARADVLSAWPAIRCELVALFDRMRAHNLRVTGYSVRKLDGFLSALLARADEEVSSACAPARAA
jgi:glycosyltransferase involved in cell wall biosynthesis